jgi:hypothetical protein
MQSSATIGIFKTRISQNIAQKPDIVSDGTRLGAGYAVATPSMEVMLRNAS